MDTQGGLRAPVKQEELKREIVASRTSKPTDILGRMLLRLCDAAVRKSRLLRTRQEIDDAVSLAVLYSLRHAATINLEWPADRMLPYFWSIGVNAGQEIARRRECRERRLRELQTDALPDRHYGRNGPR